MNGGKSMRKKRHNYTPEEKVSILRRHLVEHVAVSDLCDEYQLQPNIFYIWQKQFFENGAAAFVRDDRPQKRVEEVRIQQLEAKLVRKHEVLSELMEEHIKLKKELGELYTAFMPRPCRRRKSLKEKAYEFPLANCNRVFGFRLCHRPRSSDELLCTGAGRKQIA
jgi:transposase-like protein